VVEINNSYATGNVTVKDSAKNVRVFAGGLIGDIYRTDANGATTVTITNCYSSGAVSATNGYSSTHGAANYYTGAGGLVGCITDYNTGAGGVIVTIENSAAIGSSALFSVGNDGTPTVNGRFIGRPASETKAPTLTLSGNIAFKDMLVGTGSGSADGQTGAADDDPLAQGLTLQELKNPGVWSGSPLNWPSAVWDFSKVNAGTWPTLKQ
ncbi:MAG: hypothetical protein LBC77_03550, partial [Spirochaetaceae bacterium]|jgi:hypothetical protein|nr:hypothetical protein [Spirochaetaceae bacterium]